MKGEEKETERRTIESHTLYDPHRTNDYIVEQTTIFDTISFDRCNISSTKTGGPGYWATLRGRTLGSDIGFPSDQQRVVWVFKYYDYTNRSGSCGPNT